MARKYSFLVYLLLDLVFCVLESTTTSVFSNELYGNRQGQSTGPLEQAHEVEIFHEVPLVHDVETYKEHSHIERAINGLKRFRAVSTRFDKRAANYFATCCLIATLTLL